MKATCISIPELALIAGTRAALGAGIALIAGEQLTKKHKKAVGWTLLLIGVVTHGSASGRCNRKTCQVIMRKE